jgi:hypothetical protein
MIDIYVRTFTRVRFRDFMVTRNLMRIETIEGTPTYIFELGVDVDDIGNVIVTPGVYDTSVFPPIEITPPVIDPAFSWNLRLSGDKFLADQDTVYEGEDEQQEWRFVRSKIVKFIRNNATVVMLRGTIRAYQFGTGNDRIQFLDPRDIPEPPRVWFGGMHP